VLLSINKVINKIIRGDALKILKQLPDESVDCVVTSPPYWALRDYGVKGQLGLERTFHEYLSKLCGIFDEAQRVLKRTGTCWVNMGDTYASSAKGGGQSNIMGDNLYLRLRRRARLRQAKFKAGLPAKSLCQIPARFAIEMTNRGWILRNEIIWWKPNCMPSSAKDRFTVDFEKLFFFVKSRKYYFKQQYDELRDRERLRRRLLNPTSRKKRVYGEGMVSAINPKTAEASRARMLRRGRHKRCVWRVATRPYYANHFATYPPELIETPIKAGCPEGGIVLDPFMGSGTTALVARQLNRRFVGIELSREYVRLAGKRLPKR
jgi:DNA modification methylase